jgi:hypothetical protein
VKIGLLTQYGRENIFSPKTSKPTETIEIPKYVNTQALIGIPQFYSPARKTRVITNMHV